MSNQVISNMQEPEKGQGTGTTTVHYRIIADEELALLHPLFTRLGWALPDPSMCKAIVAEAGEGESALILGFVMVQFITHAEPMWVNADCRGMGLAEGLTEAAIHYIEHDCGIKRWVCTAKPGSLAARLAEKYGLRPAGEMWVKQVE